MWPLSRNLKTMMTGPEDLTMNTMLLQNTKAKEMETVHPRCLLIPPLHRLLPKRRKTERAGGEHQGVAEGAGPESL